MCGGRDYGNLASIRGNRAHSDWPRLHAEYRNVLDTLTRLSCEWPQTPPDEYGNSLPAVTLIEGGATGADECAVDWAIVNWVPVKTIPANWKLYGRKAGPLRNEQMLLECPDLVIAFPGGRGTKNMIKLAKAAGVKVIEIN